MWEEIREFSWIVFAFPEKTWPENLYQIQPKWVQSFERPRQDCLQVYYLGKAVWGWGIEIGGNWSRRSWRVTSCFTEIFDGFLEISYFSKPFLKIVKSRKKGSKNSNRLWNLFKRKIFRRDGESELEKMGLQNSYIF